jgi:hypothetical protein
MEQLIKILAQHWGLSPANYFHLHILTSLMLVPLLAVLYVVLFDKHKPTYVHKLRLHKHA